MNYWLDLFTGKTWEEFRKAGENVSGFRQRMRGSVKRIKPGDILLCYLTGVMRWVGALEVVGQTTDKTPIWEGEDFPERLSVKASVVLNPEHGVPMDDLAEKVDFFSKAEHRGKFKGFVRMSPNLFKRKTDGDLILSLLRKAQENPVHRPVDPKKLARRYLYTTTKKQGRSTVPVTVSIPEPEQESSPSTPDRTEQPAATTQHTEIQYHLLKLGSDIGFDVWVARNDRSKLWDGKHLGAMPRAIDKIPTQFNEATNKTIELIDVLWLKGNSIVAAFEVECTTQVYSGLLRMSDLLSLQPNLEIKLYLVAPDERAGKVEQEILRPTFNLRDKPLPKICGFIPFSKLLGLSDGIRKLGLSSALKPTFLDTVTEYFDKADRL